MVEKTETVAASGPEEVEWGADSDKRELLEREWEAEGDLISERMSRIQGIEDQRWQMLHLHDT